MISVPSYFHTYAKDTSASTRITILSFPNNLAEYHFDDNRWVQTNGTLVAPSGESNSNSIIAQEGIKISETYSKSDNPDIGCSSSKTLEITFINDPSVFASYDWSRPIVIEFFYDRDDLGIAYATLGVFWLERPTITTSELIHVKGHDAMYMLDQIPATSYIANVWNSTGTLAAKIAALASYVSKYYVTVPSVSGAPNASYSYSSNPFPSDQISIRKVLEYIAGVMGRNARVNAANQIVFPWVTQSGVQFDCEDAGGNPIPNNIISMEFADYTVADIDQFYAASGSNGFVGEFPPGPASNPVRSYNNPLFMDITQVMNVAGALTDAGITPSYRPSTIKMYADVSLEAGDMFEILRHNGQRYENVWIIQQTLEWHGGPWIAVIISSGTEYRMNEDQAAQEQFGTENGIYEAQNRLKYYDVTTAKNYTIGSGNYAYDTVPSALSGHKILAITPLAWTSNSGAFSLLPYGANTDTYWYIVGASGTTINGLQVRFWYV